MRQNVIFLAQFNSKNIYLPSKKKNESPIKRLFKDSNTVCFVSISPKINITMTPL